MQQLVEKKPAKEDEGGSVTVSVVVPETEVPVDSTTSAEEAQPQKDDRKENKETKEGVIKAEGGTEKVDPAPISHADVERPGSKLSRIEEEPEPAPQPE